MSKPKVTKTFRLDRQTLATITALAKSENRTLSNMVETLLKEEVAKRKKSITP